MGTCYSMDALKNDYTKLRKWLLECLTKAKDALKCIFERVLAGLEWIWKSVWCALEALRLRQRRAEAASDANGQVAVESSEESPLRAPVQREGNRVRYQVSVNSELLTEEEEKEEEEGLDFLEQVGSNLIETVARFREFKKEYKQNKDHEMLARKLDNLNKEASLMNNIALAKNFCNRRNKIPENICL